MASRAVFAAIAKIGIERQPGPGVSQGMELRQLDLENCRRFSGRQECVTGIGQARDGIGLRGTFCHGGFVPSARLARYVGPAASRAIRFKASVVCASAGKNDSMASSASVMSSGVPNTVVVLKNESTPYSVRRRKGTTTPP